MNKTLIFFCISCCLLIFSIIVVCTGPVITGVVEGSWRNQNCQRYSDHHKYVDDKNLGGDLKDEFLKHLKKGQHLCERQKAMYGLEYASLISDLFFGVLCSLLSLLHYFGIGKYCEKITGIIGLAWAYDLHASSPPTSSPISHYNTGALVKLDKDRVFAEWKEGKYECFYYDKDDEDSFYAKYNDLGKKQYNYHKDFELADGDYQRCKISNNPTTINPKTICKNPSNRILSSCNKLYYSGNNLDDEIYYKYRYDKWVTSIIFGCFIIALNLGLAIFGFLLFSQTDGSSGK